MNEHAIYELTKIMLKEYEDKTKFIITKSELAKFCLKVIKLIEKCK